MTDTNKLIMNASRLGGIQMAVKFAEALLRGEEVQEINQDVIDEYKKEIESLQKIVKESWTESVVIDMPISGGESVQYEVDETITMTKKKDATD